MEEKKQHNWWLLVLIIITSLTIMFLIKHKITKHKKLVAEQSIFAADIQNPSTTNLAQLTTGNNSVTENLKNFNPDSVKENTISGIVDFNYWQTNNGIKVIFKQVPTLPMVDIEVAFDAGAARQDAGGLAYLTASLLNEGAGDLTATQIAEILDGFGSELSISPSKDMSIVRLRSLSNAEQLVPSLDIMLQVMKAPTFPEEDFIREQQHLLLSIKHEQEQPGQIASKAFYETLYPNQPYANWLTGTEDSVKKLTTKDLQEFFKKYYVAQNAVIVIVGDLSLNDAKITAEKISINLLQGTKAANIPQVSKLNTKITKHLEFNSQQTHILMGTPAISRHDADFYPLVVGNHILGGNGSVSRIFDIVRTKHGLAYSVYSHFLPMQVAGPFIMGCQTRADKAGESVKLMQQVLQDFLTKGPTEQELEDAKQNLLGGYALNFDSNYSLMRQFVLLAFYDLDYNRYNKYHSIVSNLTIEDIKQAFNKHISLDNLAIITVGQKNVQE